MWLSPYFTRAEFACKCGCGADTVDTELLAALNEIRHYFGRPVIISSAMRCAHHNRHVGNSPRSQHLRGKAADFIVETVALGDVVDFAEKLSPHHYGIGRYDTFVHLDVRETLARWDLRKTMT